MKKLALVTAAAAGAFLLPATASAQVFTGHHGGGWGHHGGGFHRGGSFGGFAFGGFFHQPQYHVQNWQLYGFIQPQQHQRWIRYYDDAYLVDRRGYIHDARRGVAWDRYGERWARDSYGIPYYVGNGDYHPDRRDYRRVEREQGRWSSGWDYSGYGSGCARPSPCDVVVRHHDERGYDRREHGGYERRGGGSYERRESDRYAYEGEDDGYEYDRRGGSRTRVYGGPAPAPCGGGSGYACGGAGAYGYSGLSRGYGYGGSSYGGSSYGGSSHGYGYGGAYGHGGGTVIVTETTVTPGEQIVAEEIIEEVIEEGSVRRHRATPHRRRAAPPPRRHHPAPRPAPRVVQPSGERG
jgi:hypothetical protein